MSAQTAGSTPDAFQRQPADRQRRMCGAAALAMAMGMQGHRVPLQTVWDAVAGDDPYGSLAARSFRLAAFARQRGLEAAVLQAEPSRSWQALRRCAELGLAVVLNHRIAGDREEGHFTTMVQRARDHLVVHDPGWGPHRRIARRELETLWRPRVGGEISGHVLIVVGGGRPGGRSARQAADGVCYRCGRVFCCTPAAIFRPADWLTEPLWRRFFCLHCDASFRPA